MRLEYQWLLKKHTCSFPQCNTCFNSYCVKSWRSSKLPFKLLQDVLASKSDYLGVGILASSGITVSLSSLQYDISSDICSTATVWKNSSNQNWHLDYCRMFWPLKVLNWVLILQPCALLFDWAASSMISLLISAQQLLCEKIAVFKIYI